MFKFKKLCFFFILTSFLHAQKPSYIFLDIKNKVKTAKGLSTNEQYKIKCFIRKNEKLSEIYKRDTVFCKTKIKNNPLIVELRQTILIDAKIVDNQLNGKLKNEAAGFAYTPNLKISERKLIPPHTFKDALALHFKDGATQHFVSTHDSITYTQQVTLNIPNCINEKPSEKNQGLVTVYYRAAREHLNKNQPSESSSNRAMDWGHAFIGVKDLKTGKTYFLDGWPDAKFEDGNQHFEWNYAVDSVRTADHHSITFNTDRKRLDIAIKLIENHKTACINFEVLDFNCADATTEILEKMGYYTSKEHSGTVFPNSFANNLMDKLDKIGVCYEYDGRKVR